jgi:hypothetical protein
LPVVFVDGSRDNRPASEGWHSILLVTPTGGGRLERITIS